MHTRAAVLYEPNTPLVVETVELDPPRDGEVLVKMAATGICRSDYHAMVGEWTVPLPVVLGHEAAGIIEEVGPGVTMSKPGDHVILNFRPNCGWCRFCIAGRPVLCPGTNTSRYGMFDGSRRLHKGDQWINHYARIASFAEYAVVPQTGAVPVRKDLPFGQAALVGCSVTTGVGAAINTARVQPGSSVAVFGCGGVGLNVIQGALLNGATTVIAVDILENKLAYARQFGATHVVDSSSGDPVARIREITNGGADYAFEAFGSAEALGDAYDSTCPGGVTVAVGMAPENDKVSVNALSLPRNEKVIMGSYYGSARPWIDLPRIADLYLEGKLKVDEMITREYRLDEINDAYVALKKGDNARAVIVFD